MATPSKSTKKPTPAAAKAAKASPAPATKKPVKAKVEEDKKPAKAPVKAAAKAVPAKAPAAKAAPAKVAPVKAAPAKAVKTAPAAKEAVVKAAPAKVAAAKAPAEKIPVKAAVAKKEAAPVVKEVAAVKPVVAKVEEKPVVKEVKVEPVKVPAAPPRVYPPKTPEIDLTATPAPNPLPNGGHSPAFVDKQRQRLLDLRDELVDAMSGMTRDTIRNAPEGSEASGSGMHQGDAGSDAYDRDFALSVLAKEQDALYEIEEALKRIRRSTYGVCELSGKKIPHTRLEAIPFARLTVECQAQWEKEYGNRRFRPSGQVGFSGGHYDEEDESETVSLDEDED